MQPPDAAEHQMKQYAKEVSMTLQALPTAQRNYLIVDEAGRRVGEVTGTRFPLDKAPPSDTVYMERRPAPASPHTAAAI